MSWSRFDSDTSAALGRALDFFGTHVATARALGITSKELWGARKRGRVSVPLANKIHQATHGAVRREELRPDVFPRRYREARLGPHAKSNGALEEPRPSQTQTAPAEAGAACSV